MNIGFIGLGKLGLPCALAVESKGHDVVGYDISKSVQDIIKEKKLPYKEIWAQDHLDNSNIEVVDVASVVKHSEIIFVPIQTPHDVKYEGSTRIPESRADFDYTYLKEGLRNLSEAIAENGEDKTVVIISTVLPGTIEREIKPLLNHHVKLCYNPFFIAMGTTMRDFLEPEFVLFGVDDEGAAEKAASFYRTLHDRPFYKTSIKSAELIKVAYNTFIGMKIVFANTMMEICHETGADVDSVTSAIKMATGRLISDRYLDAGMGDGGGCHPRDNIAMSWLAQNLNLSHDFFQDLMSAREDQTEWLCDIIDQNSREEDQVYILGKSFKPETNIQTGSPAVLLKNILEERGLSPICFDPYVDCKKEYDFGKGVYFIATKHKDFSEFYFPSGSTVIDPWRYIEDQENIKVIRIGENV
jgi:UDPglucose 6-dehydrogenase